MDHPHFRDMHISVYTNAGATVMYGGFDDDKRLTVDLQDQLARLYFPEGRNLKLKFYNDKSLSDHSGLNRLIEDVKACKTNIIAYAEEVEILMQKLMYDEELPYVRYVPMESVLVMYGGVGITAEDYKLLSDRLQKAADKVERHFDYTSPHFCSADLLYNSRYVKQRRPYIYTSLYDYKANSPMPKLNVNKYYNKALGKDTSLKPRVHIDGEIESTEFLSLLINRCRNREIRRVFIPDLDYIHPDGLHILLQLESDGIIQIRTGSGHSVFDFEQVPKHSILAEMTAYERTHWLKIPYGIMVDDDFDYITSENERTPADYVLDEKFLKSPKQPLKARKLLVL